MDKRTVAKLRSNDNHNKTHMVSVCFRADKNTDADVVEHLEKVENTGAYLLGLIRKDIAAQGESRYWLTISSSIDDEFGRTMQLLARNEEEAIEEAGRIKQMFNKFVFKVDEEADWILYKGVKDEFSMSGWRDLGDPIDFE